jgi:hypothetical protein
MQKDETPRVARTYRLPTRLVDELKRFREEARLRPSETSIVETALREFIDRESAEARKGARK